MSSILLLRDCPESHHALYSYFAAAAGSEGGAMPAWTGNALAEHRIRPGRPTRTEFVRTLSGFAPDSGIERVRQRRGLYSGMIGVVGLPKEYSIITAVSAAYASEILSEGEVLSGLLSHLSYVRGKDKEHSFLYAPNGAQMSVAELSSRRCDPHAHLHFFRLATAVPYDGLTDDYSLRATCFRPYLAAQKSLVRLFRVSATIAARRGGLPERLLSTDGPITPAMVDRLSAGRQCVKDAMERFSDFYREQLENADGSASQRQRTHARILLAQPYRLSRMSAAFGRPPKQEFSRDDVLGMMRSQVGAATMQNLVRLGGQYVRPARMAHSRVRELYLERLERIVSTGNVPTIDAVCALLGEETDEPLLLSELGRAIEEHPLPIAYHCPGMLSQHQGYRPSSGKLRRAANRDETSMAERLRNRALRRFQVETNSGESELTIVRYEPLPPPNLSAVPPAGSYVKFSPGQGIGRNGELFRVDRVADEAFLSTAPDENGKTRKKKWCDSSTKFQTFRKQSVVIRVGDLVTLSCSLSRDGHRIFADGLSRVTSVSATDSSFVLDGRMKVPADFGFLSVVARNDELRVRPLARSSIDSERQPAGAHKAEFRDGAKLNDDPTSIPPEQAAASPSTTDSADEPLSQAPDSAFYEAEQSSPQRSSATGDERPLDDPDPIDPDDGEFLFQIDPKLQNSLQNMFEQLRRDRSEGHEYGPP